MSLWPREDVERFYSWLWPKFEWQLLMAGAVGVSLLAIWTYLQLTAPRSSPSGSKAGRRYAELPSACRCEKCGYVWENPGVHCSELTKCPKCGATGRIFWRVK